MLFGKRNSGIGVYFTFASRSGGLYSGRGNAYALVDTIQGELPEVNKERCPGVVVREQDGMLRVEAAGKSAHAAFPEGSINASVMLADYLCGHPFLTDKAKRTLAFLSECFENYYGEALGIAYDGGPLGKLTIVAE